MDNASLPQKVQQALLAACLQVTCLRRLHSCPHHFAARLAGSTPRQTLRTGGGTGGKGALLSGASRRTTTGCFSCAGSSVRTPNASAPEQLQTRRLLQMFWRAKVMKKYEFSGVWLACWQHLCGGCFSLLSRCLCVALCAEIRASLIVLLRALFFACAKKSHSFAGCYLETDCVALHFAFSLSV